jgi:hypothetical protein
MDNSMKLDISRDIREKLLTKHNVTEEDIIQCFSNDYGLGLLYDDREDHKTDPRTQWFIGETDFGRRLKVALVFDGHRICIKTAYPPNAEEERIYAKFAKRANP